VAYMRTQIIPADPSKPPSGHYADDAIGAVLELAVRRCLTAEETLRQATANLETVLASARRHGQTAQAAEALKNLSDRRPA
jgi:hypothetical protein